MFKTQVSCRQGCIKAAWLRRACMAKDRAVLRQFTRTTTTVALAGGNLLFFFSLLYVVGWSVRQGVLPSLIATMAAWRFNLTAMHWHRFGASTLMTGVFEWAGHCPTLLGLMSIYGTPSTLLSLISLLPRVGGKSFIGCSSQHLSYFHHGHGMYVISPFCRILDGMLTF